MLEGHAMNEKGCCSVKGCESAASFLHLFCRRHWTMAQESDKRKLWEAINRIRASIEAQERRTPPKLSDSAERAHLRAIQGEK